MGWLVNYKPSQQKTPKKEQDNYYDSPQFYEDLDQAERDIAEGKGLRVNSKEELDALFV